MTIYIVIISVLNEIDAISEQFEDINVILSDEYHFHYLLSVLMFCEMLLIFLISLSTALRTSSAEAQSELSSSINRLFQQV